MLRPFSRVGTIFPVSSKILEKIKHKKTIIQVSSLAGFVLFVLDSCTSSLTGGQSCPVTFDEHFSELKNSLNRWMKERKSSKL